MDCVYVFSNIYLYFQWPALSGTKELEAKGIKVVPDLEHVDPSLDDHLQFRVLVNCRRGREPDRVTSAS